VARATWRAVVCLGGGTAAACARRPAVGLPGAGVADRGPTPGRASGGAPNVPDLAGVYRRMGLAVGGGEVPFVGHVAYLAGATPDSTLALVTLSFANRAFTFAREASRRAVSGRDASPREGERVEGYRAEYQVRLEVRRAAAGVAVAAATVPVLREVVRDAVVRVATFGETARSDESVVHTQTLALPPGRYTLAVTVREGDGNRTGTADLALAVPRLGAGVTRGGLSTPVAVYEARLPAPAGELPPVLANARATAVYGRDSVAPVYVEAYGGAPADSTGAVTASVLLRDDRGALVWRDTLALARRGPARYAGVARVPLARVGFGVVTFQVVRRELPADTASTSLFVTLGDELPAATFGQALDYLRDFAAPERLRLVREAPPAARAVRWAAFLRETDPDPRTPRHEALADYLARLRTAAVRFAEDRAPGWATDRGRAYAVLGEPDQITDANVPEQGQRGRTQVWEYRTPRVQLVFTDQHGLGRWRLAPAGAAMLHAERERRLAR